jgi:serine/threonine protein kinase
MRAISHPNVIHVLEADLEHSPPFLVMPLADTTLDRWATEHRSDTSAILSRFLEVCDGLHAAHGVGLLHRDVKPLNMLVFANSTVVADFGLARDVSREMSKLTRSTTVLGTDEYLAPEQRARGGSRAADARTDVYMLGRSLYELLTGESPSLIDDQAVDPGIAAVILKATAEIPNRRYASVSELSDAVRTYQKSLDPLAHVDVQLRAAIAQANELLQQNRYRKDNFRHIMQLWLSVQDAQLAAVLWDEMPERLMPQMVRADEALAEQCIRRLGRVYDEVLDARPWAYAEDVADRMLAMTKANPPASLWAAAMRLALLAAVKMNRFAAMDTFNTMLADIKDERVAAVVADMLREERGAYRRVAAQLQPGQLALALRPVRDAVLQ